MNKKKVIYIVVIVVLISCICGYFLWGNHVKNLRADCSRKAQEVADREGRYKSQEEKTAVYEREYLYCTREAGVQE